MYTKGLERTALVVVDKYPYLFVREKVSRRNLPKNMVAYDVASNGYTRQFCRIQKILIMNRIGTIIGFHALPLKDNAYYCRVSEGRTAGYLSLEEYLKIDQEACHQKLMAEDLAMNGYKVGRSLSLIMADGLLDSSLIDIIRQQLINLAGVKLVTLEIEDTKEAMERKRSRLITSMIFSFANCYDPWDVSNAIGEAVSQINRLYPDMEISSKLLYIEPTILTNVPVVAGLA